MGDALGRRGRGALAVACSTGLVALVFAGCGLDSDGAADVVLDAASLSDVYVFGPRDAVADNTVHVDASSDAYAHDASPEGAADVQVPDAHHDAGADACTPTEADCLDGLDNDCNGLVDCADPACSAGFRCVPDAPPTFTGFALYEASRASSCPTSFPTHTDTFDGLTFKAASCLACACTASGAACTGASALDCGPTAQCTSLASATATATTTCADLAAPLVLVQTDFCNVAAPAATGGSCAPASGGTPDNATPSFATLSRVCGGGRAGGGCGAAQACVAKTPAAPHGVCVMQTVANGAALPACPAAYANPLVVSSSATSFSDGRSCTPCACDATPTGASCASSLTLFGSTACVASDAGPNASDAAVAPGVLTIASDGTCHTGLVPIASEFESTRETLSVATQGTCGASGGAPQGTVVQTNRTIYCCEN